MASAATDPLDKVDGIEMAPMLPAADCPRPDARTLMVWWDNLGCAEGDLPDWRNIDPISLLPWMGWICLYDLIDGGRDVRYRLVGTRIAEQAGVDLTGRFVSQGVYASTPGVLLEHFRRLGQRAVPTWTKRVMETQHGFTITHDRIWLPFRRNSDSVVLWLLYVCKLESEAYRLDVARLSGMSRRHTGTGLVPVSLNPPSRLRV